MKSLKILLGNITLNFLGGSETWTYTLATVLKKMGHRVNCFSPELGVFSSKLEKQEIKCFNQMSSGGIKPFTYILDENNIEDYDIIISNHHQVVEYLREIFPKTPIISTVHGIIHFIDQEKSILAPEHPSLNSGVSQFIAVSEEVRDKLKNDYNLDSEIIRNFINLDEFSTDKPISETPQRIFVNTNYNSKEDEEIKVIKEVADHYGAKVSAVGLSFSPSLSVRKAIEDSDIVVGMGRSVLEGLAMGRIGIVHGRWGTAGIIHDDQSAFDMAHFNFSGRCIDGKQPIWTAEKLVEEIDKYYNNKISDWSKDYIARHHNASLAAERFVRIARELSGGLINNNRDQGRSPYIRAKDVTKGNS